MTGKTNQILNEVKKQVEAGNICHIHCSDLCHSIVTKVQLERMKIPHEFKDEILKGMKPEFDENFNLIMNRKMYFVCKKDTL